MPVTAPYDWIKEVPRSALERDSVPLTGNSPSFPWKEFQDSLNALFQTQVLSLRPQAPQWRNAEELSVGIDHPVTLHFNVEPLSGPVYWLLSAEDISTLMSWLIAHTNEPLRALKDQSLLDGFYHFLAIECCHLISATKFDPTVTPKLVNAQPLPTDSALCIDVGIGYQQEQELRGRLVLSNEFYQSWKNYYADRTLSRAIPEALAAQVELTVRLEAGHTQIRKSELAQAKPGDFLVLDHCSIQPKTHKGRVILIVNGVPLFRGKLKQGNIKVLELPLFYEVGNPMEGDNSNDEFDKDQASDEEGAHEAEHHDEVAEHEESHVEESHVEEETHTDEHSEYAGMEMKKVDLQELPITLNIEVGRLQMSVKKLLELQAGNLLETDVSPEDGVDLVINGKCIGKGELIRVGEMLGVRILDLK